MAFWEMKYRDVVFYVRSNVRTVASCVTAGMQVVAKKHPENQKPPKLKNLQKYQGTSPSPKCDFELCYCNIKENSDLRSVEAVLTSRQMKFRLQEIRKRRNCISHKGTSDNFFSKNNQKVWNSKKKIVLEDIEELKELCRITEPKDTER